MKLMTIPATALAATFVFAQSAQAREFHHHHSLYRVASQHWPRAAEPSRQPQQFAGGFWNNSEVPADRVVSRRRSRMAEPLGHQQSAGGLWSNPEAPAYNSGLGGRPAAWCGWEMRQLVGADPGPQYNLARNWAQWGHSGPAGVGAVVVWPHHVGKIVGQQGGEWIVESGNDGHALRTRPLSIAGAIAIRWG
jgi:hypothetical protein